MFFAPSVAFAQEPVPDAAPAEGVADVDAERWTRPGVGFGGLPAVNYNSDDGFGFGAVASVYGYDGQTAPYKWSMTGLLFLTTKAVHTHRVDVDALELAGGKLRLTTRAEFYAVNSTHYCGVGPAVSCAEAEAEGEADALQLEGTDRDDFLRRYYLTRWVRPNGYVNARLELADAPAKLEAMFGWRGELLVPGSFTERGPYPGSKYNQDFGDGEAGMVSVLQAGLMLDGRDNEPAPRHGTWAEGSIRGGTIAWGSTFPHFGFNTILRRYDSIADDRLTLATRVVFDGLVGDVPTTEQAQVGGSEVFTAFGGARAGRGIRSGRFLGRVKGIVQPELRLAFARFDAGPSWELTVLSFVDLGWVAEDWAHLDQLAAPPLVGTGGGLRIAMDQNFIVRVDVGVSQVEGWSPGIYIDLDHIF